MEVMQLVESRTHLVSYSVSSYFCSSHGVSGNGSGSRHLDAVLREVYVLYSDFVLKNPFYESDMPIQCEKFDEKVQRLAADYNRR